MLGKNVNLVKKLSPGSTKVQPQILKYVEYVTVPMHLQITQEKNSCSLVLKLKVFISKYLQEHYTRCITRAALFFKNVPGTFFNATHQVKAIAIGVSEVNPLGELRLFHSSSLYT